MQEEGWKCRFTVFGLGIALTKISPKNFDNSSCTYRSSARSWEAHLRLCPSTAWGCWLKPWTRAVRSWVPSWHWRRGKHLRLRDHAGAGEMLWPSTMIVHWLRNAERESTPEGGHACQMPFATFRRKTLVWARRSMVAPAGGRFSMRPGCLRWRSARTAPPERLSLSTGTGALRSLTGGPSSDVQEMDA